ncbi:phage tail protein [Lysinibacillus sp. RS5]|uniref:phage tail protein n=1 Tax=unclassified Lysinibacillus TaxID=2636778 RepID=UPI0035BE400D
MVVIIQVTSRIGSGTVTKYKNLTVYEELNGTYTLSFIALNTKDNEGYRFLIDESLIQYDGVEYRIKQTKANMLGTEVTAFANFFDLGGERQEEIYGGTKEFDDFMAFVLKNTGWTFTNVDVSGTYFIPNFGHDSVLKLLNGLCQLYGCEYKIMPNKHLLIAKKIGPKELYQYRYKVNIKTIAKVTDSTSLKTVVTGRDAEGTSFTYKSPNVALFGEIKADDVESNDLRGADEMLPFLQSQIQDYPDMTLELDTIEIVNRELGETVWLIHEPMGIEFETRILAQKKMIRDGKLIVVSAVLGTKLPKSQYDAIVGQQMQLKENRDEYRSLISQTNDNIVLQVENINKSIAKIDLKADEIDLSVNNRITNEMAKINLRADNIQLEVNNNQQQIARIDIKADSISQTVTNNKAELDALDGRVGTAESEISQNAYQISLKVSQTDFNGNTIVNKINLDSSGVQIYGRNIDLHGAVNVLSEITGELGVINTGTLNSVNINSANIDIHDDVKIGRNLTLQGSGANKITFSDMTSITSDGAGSILIDLFNNLDVQAYKTIFWRNVDFSNANVTGLRGVFFNGSNRCYLKDERGNDICYWAATPA